MRTLLTIAVLCFAANANAATASLVTLDFTGVVNQIISDRPLVGFNVGPVYGSIVYDLSTPDTDPNLDTGQYRQFIPGGFVIQTGSVHISMDQYDVSVFNRVPGEGPSDALSFSGRSAPYSAGLGFQSDRDVLDSSALPPTFDLAALGQVDATGGISYHNGNGGLEDFGWQMYFTLLTLASRPVPEPTSLTILSSAIVALAAFNRRKGLRTLRVVWRIAARFARPRG